MRSPVSRTLAAWRPLAVGLSFSLTSAAVAQSPCVTPSPPDVSSKPAKPVAPPRPACADAVAPAPGCTTAEVTGYNDAVRDYNARLPVFSEAANAYVARLNDYVKASGDYARCEAESLR